MATSVCLYVYMRAGPGLSRAGRGGAAATGTGAEDEADGNSMIGMQCMHDTFVVAHRSIPSFLHARIWPCIIMGPQPSYVSVRDVMCQASSGTLFVLLVQESLIDEHCVCVERSVRTSCLIDPSTGCGPTVNDWWPAGR